MYFLAASTLMLKAEAILFINIKKRPRSETLLLYEILLLSVYYPKATLLNSITFTSPDSFR